VRGDYLLAKPIAGRPGTRTRFVGAYSKWLKVVKCRRTVAMEFGRDPATNVATVALYERLRMAK
jgi:hypothetical protein